MTKPLENRPAFHLAIAVYDLVATEAFYTSVLGCDTGRRDKHWIDFNFHGHQLVAHLVNKPGRKDKVSNQTNTVDKKHVPLPHFGVIREWIKWEIVAQNLRDSKINFIIEPYIRFAGQTGEQATMFFCDPSGNAIEIKAFRQQSDIFRK